MRTVAVCDDDRLQLERAVQLLQCHMNSVGIDAAIEPFVDIEACVRESPSFDAVFMDIEFEGDSRGIDAAACINKKAPNCQIVYLTNYLHYALDVYGTEHSWYVLKDQLELRLPEIFQKLSDKDTLRHEQVVVTPIGAEGVVNISCADISYLEREHRVTHIFMRDGACYEVREKLTDLLTKLPESMFARCHNSYAVNMASIKAIRKAELNLETGAMAPVSRSYAKRFRAKYLAWAEAWTV